jgi:hypothetical protein
LLKFFTRSLKLLRIIKKAKKELLNKFFKLYTAAENPNLPNRSSNFKSEE